MIFRSLESSDSAAIADLFEKSFSDGWDENMLRSGFNGGLLHALGAFDGQKLVGVITYSLGIDSADVEDLAVLPEMRRKKIAKLLVIQAIERIKRSVGKILLEVRETNAAAIALYISVGFKKISVRKKYYADGENALVMAKEI